MLKLTGHQHPEIVGLEYYPIVALSLLAAESNLPPDSLNCACVTSRPNSIGQRASTRVRKYMHQQNGSGEVTICSHIHILLCLPFFDLTGARDDSHSEKEVVILTDGKSNCGPNAIKSAEALRNTRTPPLLVFVFAIGNHNTDSRLEMEAMSSTPTSYHLFHMKSFVEFRDVVNFIMSNPNNCSPVEISITQGSTINAGSETPIKLENVVHK